MTRVSYAVQSGATPSKKEVCHWVSNVAKQHYRSSWAGPVPPSLLVIPLPSKSSAVLLVIYTLSSQSGKRHHWMSGLLACVITHLEIKSPTQHTQPYFSQFLRTASRKCLLYPLVCGIPVSKGQDSPLFEVVFILPEPWQWCLSSQQLLPLVPKYPTGCSLVETPEDVGWVSLDLFGYFCVRHGKFHLPNLPWARGRTL